MMVLVASAVVKPNADQAFAEQFERHLFPSLQVQPGFRGEIVLVSPGAPEVILITFWDSDANARSYERSAWPESVKTLTNILNPAVFRRFQLAHSTLHPEGVATFPCSRRLRRNRPEWSGGRPARRLVGGSQIQPEECAISFFHTTRDATNYHGSRTHLALDKDAPEPRDVGPPEHGRVIGLPQVGGLHHRYVRRAA